MNKKMNTFLTLLNITFLFTMNFIHGMDYKTKPAIKPLTQEDHNKNNVLKIIKKLKTVNEITEQNRDKIKALISTETEFYKVYDRLVNNFDLSWDHPKQAVSKKCAHLLILHQALDKSEKDDTNLDTAYYKLQAKYWQYKWEEESYKNLFQNTISKENPFREDVLLERELALSSMED